MGNIWKSQSSLRWKQRAIHFNAFHSRRDTQNPNCQSCVCSGFTLTIANVLHPWAHDHKTPKGGAWLGLAGCPSEWKDLWHLHHLWLMCPPQKPTLAESVHFTTSIRQVEPQWDNQDGGWGVRPEAVYCMYSLGLYGLHLKPGSAQALILENRTNSLITPQNATHLFGGKFQIWLFA